MTHTDALKRYVVRITDQELHPEEEPFLRQSWKVVSSRDLLSLLASHEVLEVFELGIKRSVEELSHV